MAGLRKNGQLSVDATSTKLIIKKRLLNSVSTMIIDIN